MLYVPAGGNNFGLSSLSHDTQPAAAYGVSVTPGTGGYGSYVQLFAATTYDSYGIMVCINNNNTAAASRNTILKVAVDTAGGTSYVDFLTGLVCGSAATYSGGMWYYFPLFIPAGSTVGVAGFGSVATAFNVVGKLFQKPIHPDMCRVGFFMEAIGASGIGGTSITPGTASEGGWTSLGTTTKNLWWWQVGMQVPTTDTAWGAGIMQIDLAVGDATNKDIIIANHPQLCTSSETWTTIPEVVGCEWEVPAGSTIYARARFSGTLDTYTIVAYGMGG